MKKIKYLYLWLITKILHILQRLNIIPKIWYKSELEISKMEAEKIAEFFEKVLERNNG